VFRIGLKIVLSDTAPDEIKVRMTITEAEESARYLLGACRVTFDRVGIVLLRASSDISASQ
jgi:hypothetical protein